MADRIAMREDQINFSIRRLGEMVVFTIALPEPTGEIVINLPKEDALTLGSMLVNHGGAESVVNDANLETILAEWSKEQSE